MKELIRFVPLPSRSAIALTNSDYCMNVSYLKDCYLTFNTSYCENCCYCDELLNSKDCFDISNGEKLEISYDSLFNKSCYKAIFSNFCENSDNIIFCKDCTGISNCFCCVGLRNKSYYIFNKPYTKEEYLEKIKDFNLGSYQSLIDVKNQVLNFWLKFPEKYIHGSHDNNVNGDYIWNSKNIRNSYNIRNSENLKYCQGVIHDGGKDCFDQSLFGRSSELIYESAAVGINSSSLKFCFQCYPDCLDLIYSITCVSSSNLFGCVGLRNKQYCILNKQYAKEEYEELVPKIIAHMNEMPCTDKQGRTYKYGEFFPAELSPFAYNETVAQEYFPLTKEEALEQGYAWKDPDARDYKITKKPGELPDNIKDVHESILKEVIGCAHEGKCLHQCTSAFKIIEPELQFYGKMNVPLPRLCPNCRHYERLAQRNPLHLWRRKCMCLPTGRQAIRNTAKHFHGDDPCPNEFETSYAPDRPEIIYCEQCYNAEVA